MNPQAGPVTPQASPVASAHQYCPGLARPIMQAYACYSDGSPLQFPPPNARPSPAVLVQAFADLCKGIDFKRMTYLNKSDFLVAFTRFYVTNVNALQQINGEEQLAFFSALNSQLTSPSKQEILAHVGALIVANQSPPLSILKLLPKTVTINRGREDLRDPPTLQFSLSEALFPYFVDKRIPDPEVPLKDETSPPKDEGESSQQASSAATSQQLLRLTSAQYQEQQRRNRAIAGALAVALGQKPVTDADLLTQELPKPKLLLEGFYIYVLQMPVVVSRQPDVLFISNLHFPPGVDAVEMAMVMIETLLNASCIPPEGLPAALYHFVGAPPGCYTDPITWLADLIGAQYFELLTQKAEENILTDPSVSGLQYFIHLVKLATREPYRSFLSQGLASRSRGRSSRASASASKAAKSEQCRPLQQRPAPTRQQSPPQLLPRACTATCTALIGTATRTAIGRPAWPTLTSPSPRRRCSSLSQHTGQLWRQPKQPGSLLRTT